MSLGTRLPRYTPSSSPRAGWTRGTAQEPGSPSAPRASRGQARRLIGPLRRGCGTTCGRVFPTRPPSRARRGSRPSGARWRTAPSRDLVGYFDTRGLLPLRLALAEYLARARGVVVTPDQVIVCAGFAQGLELLCDLLRASGRPVLAVEAYGHEQHRRIAKAAGMRLAPIPVDEQGARLGGGGGLPARTGAALLTPAHQYPLGMALAPGAPPGRGRLGSRERLLHHRGRLRRRVPVRPAGRRRASGTRSRARRVCRHGQQEPRSRPSSRLARAARAAGRAGR